MPTTITSAGITFNDATTLTSANIGTTQLVNGSVTAAKLGTTEQKQIAKAWVNFNGTTSPGTIRSSYNVSSVTKIQTGVWEINLTDNISTDSVVFASGKSPDVFPGNFREEYDQITHGHVINSSKIGVVNLHLASVAPETGAVSDDTQTHVIVFGN